MAQRRIFVQGIGEVILAKRRGSRNMRLSINSRGQVRVGMPFWTPYEAGLLFLKSKKNWINAHLANHSPNQLLNGSRIGKAHKLYFIYRLPQKNDIADSRVTPTTVEIYTKLPIMDARVQKKAESVCERALKAESSQLLPSRVGSISERYNLEFSELKIRKLTSRWGSCSSSGSISLSYFLIQLPWELIDYVILHELAHTKILRHGPDFWSFMESRMPNVKSLKKELKNYKPRIEPF